MAEVGIQGVNVKVGRSRDARCERKKGFQLEVDREISMLLSIFACPGQEAAAEVGFQGVKVKRTLRLEVFRDYGDGDVLLLLGPVLVKG